METWKKSSYSNGNGGDCVEVAAAWRTSSYTHNGGNCVEVADSPETVKVRDTRNRDLGYLSLPAHEWRAFVAALCHDEL